MTKQEQIQKLKAEAFDAFQNIKRAEAYYNNVVQELMRVEQTPDTEAIEEIRNELTVPEA